MPINWTHAAKMSGTHSLRGCWSPSNEQAARSNWMPSSCSRFPATSKPPSHSPIVHQHNPPGRANDARLPIVSMWTVRFCKCSGNLYGFCLDITSSIMIHSTKGLKIFLVQVEVSTMLGCVYDVHC